MIYASLFTLSSPSDAVFFTGRRRTDMVNRVWLSSGVHPFVIGVISAGPSTGGQNLTVAALGFVCWFWERGG